MFDICITEDLDSLLADDRSWNSLTRGVPFRSTAWLRPWWRQFGQGKRGYAITVHDADSVLRGLLPLYQTIDPANGRVLRNLGDGKACTDYFSVLAAESDAMEIAHSIGQFLATQAADPKWGWDLIDLDGVVEGDRVMAAFARGLKEMGSSLHTRSRMSVWYKPADENWTEHLKHHGKTQRRQMRRMAEKLQDANQITRCLATTEAEVQPILDSLIAMHQQRWQEVGEPGTFGDPRLVDFIHEAAALFFDQEALFLNLLKSEGEDVAAEVNFVGADRVMYCYSAGYRLERADLEPGRLARIDSLQHLYHADLKGIDFMRGDETYKQRFATESRRLLQLRVAPSSFLPRLRHAAWCTGFGVKQWARRTAGRPLIEVLDITGMSTAEAEPEATGLTSDR